VGLREEGEGFLDFELFFGGEVVLFGELGAAFGGGFGGRCCCCRLFSLGSLRRERVSFLAVVILSLIVRRY
jgi:hypothetical protein